MDFHKEMTEFVKKINDLYNDVCQMVEVIAKFNDVLERLIETTNKLKLYQQTGETLKELYSTSEFLKEFTDDLNRKIKEVANLEKKKAELLSEGIDNLNQTIKRISTDSEAFFKNTRDDIGEHLELVRNSILNFQHDLKKFRKTVVEAVKEIENTKNTNLQLINLLTEDKTFETGKRLKRQRWLKVKRYSI